MCLPHYYYFDCNAEYADDTLHTVHMPLHVKRIKAINLLFPFGIVPAVAVHVSEYIILFVRVSVYTFTRANKKTHDFIHNRDERFYRIPCVFVCCKTRVINGKTKTRNCATKTPKTIFNEQRNEEKRRKKIIMVKCKKNAKACNSNSQFVCSARRNQPVCSPTLCRTQSVYMVFQ